MRKSRAFDRCEGNGTIRSCCKSCSIPNGKLLPIFPPLVFSYRLSIFTNLEISRLELKFKESLLRKTVLIFKGGIGQESNGAANQEKQIFLLCQISPLASSTRDLGTRLGLQMQCFDDTKFYDYRNSKRKRSD